MIIGPVGSGKVRKQMYYFLLSVFFGNNPFIFFNFQSSLLMALLHELPLTSGEIHISRNLAYVSQSAWAFSGTLKENVLFGQPYIKEKYKKVIKACALDKVCLCYDK